MAESKAKTKIKKVDYLQTIGRRKTSTARVRLFLKKGDLTVNSLAMGKYFPGVLATTKYLAPFKLTGTLDKYGVSVKVAGGGKESQLEAMVQGIARALIKVDPAYRPGLKKAGLLSRDDRMKQSRMVGTGGKARRKKQSPKR